MVASSSGSIPVKEASASHAGLCRATHQAPFRDQGSPHHSTRTRHNPRGCIVALPPRPRASAALPRNRTRPVHTQRLTLTPNELHPSSFRLAAGALAAPAAYLRGFFRALRCAAGVAGSRACPAVFAALPAAPRSNHYVGGADRCTGASAARRGPDRSGLPALQGGACVSVAAGEHTATRRTRARGERPGRPGSTWTTTGARAAAGATTIKPAKGWFCAP